LEQSDNMLSSLMAICPIKMHVWGKLDNLKILIFVCSFCESNGFWFDSFLL